MNKEEKLPSYGKLLAQNFRLEHNYKVLSNKVDKVIEYIEKNTERDYLEYYSGYKNVIESEKILEILRGDNNE